MATPKIQSTKNYRLFKRSVENRDSRLTKHKRLERSMKQYGFLSCFPIICHRNGDKHLIVKDGQHRLAIAERLGLPVFWVEDNSEFDIAEINSTSVSWKMDDYAIKYAHQGKADYHELLDFASNHQLPLSNSAAILAGTTTYGNIREAFMSGKFKVKDRVWADSIASIYVPLVTLSPCLRHRRFLEACMAVCRVDDFDARRLTQNATRCRDKLLSYSTRDANLDMLEEVYNFGRKQLVGLKAAAKMAMRERDPAMAHSDK